MNVFTTCSLQRFVIIWKQKLKVFYLAQILYELTYIFLLVTYLCV
ncbi:hypothetical protein HMPREF3232_00319 [Fannyhessea vaginae]|nr:hypothetical protein HMPREF3232_00319 [Fannyhessea vaginae]